MTGHTPWPTQRPSMLDALGIEVVERGPELVVATMPHSEAAAQPLGQFHAGALVALADSAATALCISIVHPDGEAADASTFPVAVQISANLIRNAGSGPLRCESRPAHAGRTTVVVESRVFLPDDRLAAVVTSTHFRTDSRTDSRPDSRTDSRPARRQTAADGG